MRLLFLFLILLGSVHHSIADHFTDKKTKTDANLTGHVINKNTGEHIPFFTVSLKGTTLGTATDETGHYFLKNLPVGSYTIRVNGVGYRSAEKQIVLRQGETRELNFEVEEDIIQLETVVISANKNETNRMEAPVVVHVMTPKLFENTNSVCLAQGLSFQPGLRVETNCQNCGFQQVRINGLDGPYTQLLLDGKALFSSLNGVYGIEQIPAGMIERVEVMRGGGSALYGANAIGGTVNIITKEPLNNLFMISHNLIAIGNSAYDNTTSLNASLINGQRNAGLYIFGTSRHRQHYDHDGDHFSEIGELELTTLGFRSYYKPSSQTKLTLEYHNIQEFRRGGNLFSLPPHETDITEQADHDINGGGVDFSFFSKDYTHKFSLYSSVQHTDRQSYYGAGKDPNAYGKTKDLTAIAGIQYSYNFNHLLFMPAILTAGSEYSYNKLVDKMLGYHRTIDQKVDVYSFFLQNEWKTEQFSFLLGGRLDKNSFIDYIIFSPRINLRYNPLKDISLRVSYSAGFRAPQTYAEDLHVTAVGGEVSLIQSDPNLKTEKSGSYSVSADIYHSFGRVQTNLLIEAYYTKLKHIFVVSPIGYDEEGNKILERRNGSGAKVKGINLEGKIIPHRDVQIQLGISLQQNKYNRPQSWSDDPDTKKTREMLRSPNRYGYFTFFASPFKKFGISASGTYTGSMYVPHMAGYIEKDKLEKSGDFFDTNIKLNYDFTISGNYILQLNCGIQNIFQSYQKDFDRGEFRDAGYIYGPGLPRSWFAGIKLSLN